MKKTSVYLEEEQLRRLQQLAEAERRSQSEILRDAIMLYPLPASRPPRKFAMDGIFRGTGTSVADIPEEELLEGFGK
jgi:predicted transcriptional regulator